MGDPRIDEAIALGRVPKNITAEFLNESRDNPAITGIIFVTVLTVLAVICSLLSKAFIVRRLGLDDVMTLVSLTTLNAFVGLSIELIRIGSGRHFLFIEYIQLETTIERTQVLDFAAHITYTTTLLLCRISGLGLYRRICTMHSRFIISIKTIFAFLIAGYLPQLLLLVFHCQPVTGLWPYEFEAGYKKHTCMTWGVVYVTNSSISVFCDLLIFGFAVAILWILEMPLRRKVQLGYFLLPGVVVIAISVGRLVLVVLSQWTSDMSWYYNPMLAVEVSEIGATLIALSIPGAKPMVDKYVFGKDVIRRSGRPKYSASGVGDGSPGIGLSTRKLRPQYSVLDLEFNGTHYEASVSVGSQHRNVSQTEEGIHVTVDIHVENESSGGKEARTSSVTEKGCNTNVTT